MGGGGGGGRGGGGWAHPRTVRRVEEKKREANCQRRDATRQATGDGRSVAASFRRNNWQTFGGTTQRKWPIVMRGTSRCWRLNDLFPSACLINYLAPAHVRLRSSAVPLSVSFRLFSVLFLSYLLRTVKESKRINRSKRGTVP